MVFITFNCLCPTARKLDALSVLFAERDPRALISRTTRAMGRGGIDMMNRAHPGPYPRTLPSASRSPRTVISCSVTGPTNNVLRSSVLHGGLHRDAKKRLFFVPEVVQEASPDEVLDWRRCREQARGQAGIAREHVNNTGLGSASKEEGLPCGHDSGKCAC